MNEEYVEFNLSGKQWRELVDFSDELGLGIEITFFDKKTGKGFNEMEGGNKTMVKTQEEKDEVYINKTLQKFNEEYFRRNPTHTVDDCVNYFQSLCGKAEKELYLSGLKGGNKK